MSALKLFVRVLWALRTQWQIIRHYSYALQARLTLANGQNAQRAAP